MTRTSYITSLVAILVVTLLAAGALALGASPRLGLDLQGGISAALQPDPEGEVPDNLDEALDRATQLIRQRVDSLGVAEPDIARQGNDILVQLPGVTDAERAREIIGQTAQLTFHPVETVLSSRAGDGSPNPLYAAIVNGGIVPEDGEATPTNACVVPEESPDGSIRYVANPDRPDPTVPLPLDLDADGEISEEEEAQAGFYACGEIPADSDVEIDPEPVDTFDPEDRLDVGGDGSEQPTASDAASAPAAESEAPSAPAVESEAATPSEQASGDAMRAAAEGDPSEAPSPTESTSPTDDPSASEAASPAPSESGSETPSGPLPEFEDGLPQEAPRPPIYVVGCIPTDTGVPEAVRADDEGNVVPDYERCSEVTPISGGDPVEAGDELTGDDITDAFPSIDVQGWLVQLQLDGDGGVAFQKATNTLACRRDQGQIGQLAIVLDNVVRSNPNMSSSVTCDPTGQAGGIGGGSASITIGEGSASAEAEARDLALVLSVGALPITLTEATFDTVSPTLGAAALRNGLIAGAIGLVLVGIYLVFFYRALGVIALGGLSIFGVLIFGTMALMGEVLGFTLTLAGVAGIVVAIGITADSSIIFFERIRDEVALGKSMRMAVSRGFRSAFRTNLAGNTVTLAAALILYYLAVGPVRGFALTLGLATILDIVILWAYSRSVVGLLAGRGRLTRSSVRVSDPVVPAPSEAATTGGGKA